MKKIWVTGSAGSGKTTLALQIGKTLEIPVYHRDQITWKENWEERTTDEQIEMVKQVTLTECWVFDGNRFGASKLDGRFESCDVLIHLETNRFVCLLRALRRYLKHKNNPRSDLPNGCDEEIDMVLIKYILFDYPKAKRKREHYFDEIGNHRQVLVLKDRKSIDRWLHENEIF